MSYDVHAGFRDHNITFNLYQFFKDFNAYPYDWDGRGRFEVANAIDEALQDIESRDLQELKSQYDASNRWGQVEHGIKFLKAVRDSCRAEIPEIVRVS